MRDVARVPLLTAKGEVAVAKRIEAADSRTLDAIRSEPRALSELERHSTAIALPLDRRAVIHVEAVLAASNDAASARALGRIRAGRLAADRARADFVVANLRLVIALARRYLNADLDFVDLVQEGNAGLMRAAEKFDYRLGNRFSTYAAWWVRQAMGRALADKGTTIRLPVHLTERRRRITRAAQRFAQAHGRAATANDLESATGIARRHVHAAIAPSVRALSLDGAGSTGAAIIDSIRDRDRASPEEAVVKSRCESAMRGLLSRLKPREREILSLRFGLDEGGERSLVEVGAAMGVTAARIQQIEKKALAKLAASAQREELASYLD